MWTSWRQNKEAGVDPRGQSTTHKRGGTAALWDPGQKPHTDRCEERGTTQRGGGHVLLGEGGIQSCD